MDDLTDDDLTDDELLELLSYDAVSTQLDELIDLLSADEDVLSADVQQAAVPDADVDYLAITRDLSR
jgi:hypothetical protein